MTTPQPELDHVRDLLDASFGDGPPLAAPTDRLVVGRTALRRRRRFASAGVAAALVVLVGGAIAVGGPTGSTPRGLDPATSSGEESRTDVTEGELSAELDRLAALAQVRARHVRGQKLVSNQFPAALDQDGTLVVKDGWDVTEQVPEPVDYAPPEASLGVVVTDGAQSRWMLLTLEMTRGRLSPGASADPAGKGYSRFEDWLASMVAISGGAQPDALVIVGADDRVVAGPGSTLLDVQEIDVIEGYTSPGDRVAEVRRDGRSWFAVRGHGSAAEVIPVDGAVLPESTLAALLTYVSQQMESGEGVR